MELQITGRDGALTKFRMVGGAEHAELFPHSGYGYSVQGADVVGRANKTTIRALQGFAETFTRSQRLAAPRAAGTDLTGPKTRVLVAVGSCQIGDTLSGGLVVTGFGTSWAPNADQDDLTNCYADGHSAVCYAYCVPLA